jgi:hypothetical protein
LWMLNFKAQYSSMLTLRLTTNLQLYSTVNVKVINVVCCKHQHLQGWPLTKWNLPPLLFISTCPKVKKRFQELLMGIKKEKSWVWVD